MTTLLSNIFNFFSKKRKNTVCPTIDIDIDINDNVGYTEKDYMIEVRRKLSESDMNIQDEIDRNMHMVMMHRNGSYRRSYDRFQKYDAMKEMEPETRKKTHLRLFLRVCLGDPPYK